MTRKIWHLEVPEPLYNQVEEYLNDPRSNYSHKSEFIRTAVRWFLRSEKIGWEHKIEG